MKVVAKIVVVALALVLIAQFLPGISVAGFGTALIVAIALGIVNLIIRPVLGLLTLPITLLTFGLFAFVLNALLFWGTAFLIPGFVVSGFLTALFGSLVISSVTYIADALLP